jgi:hypothetical protein
MDSFYKNGYGVFNIFSVDFCIKALEELNDAMNDAKQKFIEDLGCVISRTYISGELNALGLPHLSFAWEIRKIVRREIIDKLINEDVVCSMEGYIYYKEEYQCKKSLHQLNECDAIYSKRLKAFVALKDCYPSCGGIMIQAKGENEMTYQNLSAGDVLIIDPFRIMFKYIVPSIEKKEWIIDGEKHTIKVVTNEFCILPITYHPFEDLSIDLINQRIGTACRKRSTLSDVKLKKRRPLCNSGSHSFEEKFIKPFSFVNKEDIDDSMINFRYQNNNSIYWYLIDKEITNLIQGEDYLKK